MSRFLAFASIAALLTTAAQAQCLAAPTGTSILGPGFVKWTPGSGYASTLDVEDEGITNPPIAMTAFGNFPMAGAVGNLDQMWISSNGEIYLTDSTLALTQPVNGATYGVDSLGELRGLIAGASARVVALGDDLDMSGVGGSAWNISVDQTVPGQIRVTWTDVSRYAFATDQFSFDCTLFATGAVQYSYSTPIVGDFRYTGISIGNLVGTATSPSRDLRSGADSLAEGLLYEAFTNLTWDLPASQIMLFPNGGGGYVSAVACSPAFHASYGTGCYSYSSPNDSVHEFFTLPSLASAALQGNGMVLAPTASGYNVSWVPGGSALYVAPTGGATNVFAAVTDDGNIVVTPSAPVPVPGGSVGSLNVMSNGVVAFGATSPNGTDYTPTSAEFGPTTVSAAYTWHDWNEGELGSGRIKREEAGGILYLTWDNVESYADPDTTLNPGTVQFQIDLASGVIVVVWVAISPNDTETTWATGRPYLVGFGGPGATAPAPITLATGLPFTTSNGLAPLTLSATPAPVYTGGGSSVPITYTVSQVIDIVPPFGIGLSLLLFSVAPIPGGFDAGFLGMPGCNLNIASLDVIISLPGTAPTASVVLSVPQPLSPGLSFYSQALSLFTPNSLPNGMNPFGGILSNGVQSYFNTF